MLELTRSLHKYVLDYLGVEQLAAAIGGSMGGCASLEWPLCFPTRFPSTDNPLSRANASQKPYVRSIVVLATAARHSAWCIAWSEIQRSTIQSDFAFKRGRYLLSSPPRSGLAAARMCALMTYRQPESFERRFSRMRRQDNLKKSAPPPAVLTNPGIEKQASSIMEEEEEDLRDEIRDIKEEQSREQYAVQSYLYHHGDKFVGRFDPLCYIHLTHKLDTHDAARDRSSWLERAPGSAEASSDEILRGVLHVLGSSPIAPRVLVLSVTSDLLYPPEEQEFIHKNTPRSELVNIVSSEGHDGFLLEYPQIDRAMCSFTSRIGVGPEKL